MLRCLSHRIFVIDLRKFKGYAELPIHRCISLKRSRLVQLANVRSYIMFYQLLYQLQMIDGRIIINTRLLAPAFNKNTSMVVWNVSPVISAMGAEVCVYRGPLPSREQRFIVA